MEGSSGILFNNKYPRGIEVIVHEVNRVNQDITFYSQGGAIKIYLNRNNEQNSPNDPQLQENHDMYFVDWEITMENKPESPISTLPPGSPSSNFSNEERTPNNSYGVYGGNRRYRKKSHKTRKIRKSRKSRRTRK